MEYHPKYPQPFSLSHAIALDPAVALDEIARLRNSLLHLRRSQNDLQEYLQGLASGEEDLEVSQAVKENEITLHVASQDERILMLKLALTHHGHSESVASEQTSSSSRAEHRRGATGSNSNGLNDLPPMQPMSDPVEEQQHGVYL